MEKVNEGICGKGESLPTIAHWLPTARLHSITDYYCVYFGNIYTSTYMYTV